MNFFQAGAYIRFYRHAVTRYQLHSPFVFELAEELLASPRWYYAFRDVEEIRRKMLTSNVLLNIIDYGTGGGKAAKKRSVRSIARSAGSSAAQGRMLFRLAQYFHPGTILELGSSVGISTMYLAAAVREAKLLSLEGSPELAQVARMHLEILGLNGNATIREGAFEETLLPALQHLQTLDLMFLDGNHRSEPTLQYFERALPFAHAKTVFVFDDMHWSADMERAWKKIQQHPRVTLTLDFFELSLAFIDPDFREKQHLNIIPARHKLWRFF